MINVNKLKKVKSNFPVMVGKGAISKKDCEKLIDEIQNAKSSIRNSIKRLLFLDDNFNENS